MIESNRNANKCTTANEQFHEMAGATRPKFCYLCIGSGSSERQ